VWHFGVKIDTDSNFVVGGADKSAPFSDLAASARFFLVEKEFLALAYYSLDDV